ncbi:MAG: hypothetical protein WAN65_23700, partial [Candidatus Sulfotelmatobacter sp.]
RALGVPRSTFYRLAGKLKRRGWMDWRCADGLIELTMLVLENPVSKTTVLAVSKTTVLAVPKTTHEVATALEVARSSEEARSTPKSKPTQDQRSAENRARVAAIPTLSPSREDHHHVQDHHVDHHAQDHVEVEMELHAAEPPNHDDCDCVEGWLCVTDAKGHVRVKPCGRLAAWRKWQAQQEPEQIAPPASVTSAPPFDFWDMLPSLNPTQRQLPAGDTFDEVFGPSPYVRAIEGEWAEPSSQLVDHSGRQAVQAQLSGRRPAQRDVGDVLPPKFYADCIKWLAVVADVRWECLDKETRRRVDGMMREGGVARYGAEALRVELVEARRERWMTNHSHCHDGPCDGTCGHACDECDGIVMDVTDKGVLDLLGCAIYALTGDEHYGRNDSGCPNAVHERMYAA